MSVDFEEANHTFELHTFHSPTWCEHCKDFIWGLAHQGYKCKACGFHVHGKCRKKVKVECGSPHKLDKSQGIKSHGHTFISFTYHSPTWCTNCSSFIWGFQRQGWQCTDCGMNAHGRCVVSFSFPCSHSHSKKRRPSSSVDYSLVAPIPGFQVEEGSGELLLLPSPSASGDLVRSGSTASSISIRSSARESLSSSSDAYSIAWFDAPDKELWFFSEFIHKDYDLFIVKSLETFFVTTVKTHADHRVPVIGAILWLKSRKEQYLVPLGENGHPPTLLEILGYSHSTHLSPKKVAASQVKPRSELFREIEKFLVGVEAAQAAQDYAVSVVSLKSVQQTEDQIVANELSPALEEFLAIISKKTDLKNFEGFTGEFDTTSNKNGKFFYYSTLGASHIAFHVAALMPDDLKKQPKSILEEIESQNEPDFQPHKSRLELLKNNMVCLVFLEEPGIPFSPAFFPSKTIQTYICVQAERDQYRVNIVSSEDLLPFGPPLPSPPLIPRNHIKSFILHKLVNASAISMNAPVFQARRNHAVTALLLRYENELHSMTSEILK